MNSRSYLRFVTAGKVKCVQVGLNVYPEAKRPGVIFFRYFEKKSAMFPTFLKLPASIVV